MDEDSRALASVMKVIGTPRPLSWRVAVAVLCVVVPALVRWLIDGGAGGLPFVTFFPAVVLASVLLDWQLALLVAVAAALVGTRLQVSEIGSLPLSQRLVMAALYLLSIGLIVTIGHVLRLCLREADAALRQQTVLTQEMRHRFKNSLAVLNSLSVQTLKSAGPEKFDEVLTGRLRALAKAADLSFGNREPCDLRKIVEQAVEPFQVDGRILAEGPAIPVEGRVCTALMLALHELATNALKYGALSNSSGVIRIAWEAGTQSDELAQLTWVEEGGPELASPQRLGFGTRLLNTLPSAMRVDQDFRPDGLRCCVHLFA